MGAAYGTAKSGVGISSMGVMNPQLVMRNMIPVVMAGVLGIYGLIISVILVGNSLAFDTILFIHYYNNIIIINQLSILCEFSYRTKNKPFCVHNQE